MANVSANGQAGSAGTKVVWTLVFDDAANTVTITATHTTFAGGPCPDPQAAAITITQQNGQSVTVDLLTGKLDNGQDFSQASPGEILNAGPKTRTNVRLRLSADRANGLDSSTQYTP